MAHSLKSPAGAWPVACAVAFAGALTLVTPPPASAYFPLITDDTGTQGQGGHQIEVDFVYTRDTNDVFEDDGRVVDSTANQSSTVPVTYTYGVTENLDVFFGVVRQVNSARGWVNSGLGFKWNFAGEQDSGWSFAIKPTVLLPVSKNMQAKGLGNAATNWQVNIISSYIATTHELHLNAGYSSNRYAQLPDTDPQRTHLWSVSAAPVLILDPQWKLALDMGFQSNPSRNSHALAFGEVAVIYAPIKNLQLGLGVMGSVALNAQDNAKGLTLMGGLTYQF
jgi:hypothetical protein